MTDTHALVQEFERAQQQRRQQSTDAGAILEQARREADALVDSAQRQGHRDGENTSAELISAARAHATALREDAERKADALRARARRTLAGDVDWVLLQVLPARRGAH